jgi:ubiquitin C-terminal hydrolase
MKSTDFSNSGMDEGDNKKKDFKKSNCPSISECLEHFSEPEQLSSENAWFCQQCNKLQEAYKSLQVYYAPKYLIL